MTALPRADPHFDAERFVGTWHIVVTNYGFWKSRTDPTVTYEAMPDVDGLRAWRDTLHFRKRGFGHGVKPGTLSGVDVEISPGRFLWRGDGLMRLIKSPWWVMMADPSGEWAVTYFGRSNVGTAPGVDVYSRRPDLSADALDVILGSVRAHAFLKTRCGNLYATAQGGLRADRYRLIEPNRG